MPQMEQNKTGTLHFNHSEKRLYTMSPSVESSVRFFLSIDYYRKKYYPLSKTQLPFESEEIQSKSKIERILASRHTIYMHWNSLEITNLRSQLTTIKIRIFLF